MRNDGGARSSQKDDCSLGPCHNGRCHHVHIWQKAVDEKSSQIHSSANKCYISHYVNLFICPPTRRSQRAFHPSTHCHISASLLCILHNLLKKGLCFHVQLNRQFQACHYKLFNCLKVLCVPYLCSTYLFLGSRAWSVREANSLTAICEQIIQTM
jgi:hypothetical protein